MTAPNEKTGDGPRRPTFGTDISMLIGADIFVVIADLSGLGCLAVAGILYAARRLWMKNGPEKGQRVSSTTLLERKADSNEPLPRSCALGTPLPGDERGRGRSTESSDRSAGLSEASNREATPDDAEAGGNDGGGTSSSSSAKTRGSPSRTVRPAGSTSQAASLRARTTTRSASSRCRRDNRGRRSTE